jgi:GNAT superfamily N-acetyltransferase
VPDAAAWCVISGVAVELNGPDVDGLGEIVRVLREWQRDDAPMQLHPGDLGWFWQFGPDRTAAAVRTWSRDGRIVAAGLLDSPDLLRLTIAPGAQHDESVARQIVADLGDPGRGVLPAGKVSVEAPNGTRVQDLLDEVGWTAGERWTPLRRDLTEPVHRTAQRVEVIGPKEATTYTAVHRAAFGSPRFTDELWHVMAGGPPYADARSLVAYDDRGDAVAEATVWSAGPGRPGLLEPLGVHPEHRGLGFGRTISVAAAAVLQELGSSSAVVCTPSANVGAVATYESAGFVPGPERRDRCRAS